MSKRILILGAGNAQIDAIEYCKRNGYEVCGCSYTTVDCGIPHLDYFDQVDIKSVDGVVALAKKYDVAAVYSIGSDLAIPTAMEASEVLGLPHFISSETADICHSKDKLRIALGSDFEGNADFRVVTNLEDALKHDAFPAMMKPVDSQGQRGCFRVDSAEDIRSHFDVSLDYSINGRVIIETFVEGPEVSVNGYMQDGVLKFAVVSDRYVFDEYPGGIIKEHVVPTSWAKGVAEAECIDLVKRICAKIGLDNGPCYAQIKLDKNNHPVILEIAPRLDGCHMWSLIKHYCGADLLDATFRHLLESESVLDDEYETPETEYTLVFMSKEPNAKFSRSEFEDGDAEYSCYYYNDGDRVLKVNGYIEKCGYQIKKTGRAINK